MSLIRKRDHQNKHTFPLVYTIVSLITGLMAFLVIAGLFAFVYRLSDWDRLDERASKGSLRPVMNYQDMGMNRQGVGIAKTDREWSSGEGIIDEQGRPWRVEKVDDEAVYVRQDDAVLCGESDPVLSSNLLPTRLAPSSDGADGNIVVMAAPQAEGTAQHFVDTIRERGMSVAFHLGEQNLTKRALYRHGVNGTAAMIILREGTVHWVDSNGESRMEFIVEQGQPRHPSNFAFALRWAEHLPVEVRPVITVIKPCHEQHLHPRMIDVTVPKGWQPKETEKLADGLMEALDPDSLTKWNRSFIMSRRIEDIRRPGP
ncbi:hypothetical protein H1S01_01520 [Heliobacterium chlorum]|uniref:Uncharacterized protein n=1 Tax=Heliobacterium chlorum TaxID=2698 RepID=A0ABR7T0U6_HELCL|nr:hypothetical protein [Heliobacterium chlorum]MBC9783186.1 hypothetical protein [Heliobacterium chlorum]